MSKNGTDLLLLVNTGTPETPSYEVVGSQRDATIEETTDAIDISSKDQREMRVLPGRYSASISLDAVYVPDNAAYQALKSAMRNGELILVAKQDDGIVTETVSAVVNTMSEAFPDQDAATISISLTIDGAFVEVGT